MKKRLYLHIGSHKTATTFLQNSLHHNRDRLAGLGLLYPRAGQIWQAHFKLCWALKDPAQKDVPLDRLGDWPALLEEIDAAAEPAAVLSAEEFGLGLDVARLEPLKARYEVAVIFYLRSPDSYLQSFYNQFVKDFRNREARRIDTYLAEQEPHFLDTSQILAPWAALFGPAAIRLRLYGREFLPDGILADFLRALDRTNWPDFAPPDASIQHKTSLPPDALDYLRLTNPYLTREEGHHRFVTDLVQLSLRQEAELQRTRAGILSLPARQLLRRRFRDSNLRAARSFLGAARTPFPPAEAPPPPEDFDRRLPEATPEVMARVAAMIRNRG